MDTRHRYKADFNDVGEDGLVTTLPGWGGSVVVPRDGELVELVDGDGNQCLGFVARVDSNALIFVRPDWSSWQDAPESTLPTMVDELLFEAMRATDAGVTTTSDAPVPA